MDGWMEWMERGVVLVPADSPHPLTDRSYRSIFSLPLLSYWSSGRPFDGTIGRPTFTYNPLCPPPHPTSPNHAGHVMSGVTMRDPFGAHTADTKPDAQLRSITIKQLEPFLGRPAKGGCVGRWVGGWVDG
jgi:hypothetical protein